MNHKKHRPIGRRRCQMCKWWKLPGVRGPRLHRLPRNQKRRVQEAPNDLLQDIPREPADDA